MKPSKTNHQEGRLFEYRLSDQLDPYHNLLLFGGLIDWDDLEKDYQELFHQEIGAPAKPVRLMAGIFMLQHMAGLSDEETVKVWCENPYWQLFCGYDYLQWKFPVHPSSLSRWRKKLGVDGIRRILQELVRCAVDEELIKETELQQVTVDTTVMPKNITYPTDARLYYKSLLSLTRFSKKFKIELRQSYKFLSKRALRKVFQYIHARKMKQARREVKRLKTFFGRVLREVERKVLKDEELFGIAKGMLSILQQVFDQKRSDKNKIYSIHEPHVECISKGKAHKKYEFGCKASVVMTHKKNFILSCEALHGNPFDGHTLKESLRAAERVSGREIIRAFVDRGYKGHKIKETEVLISGKRGLSRHFKNQLKRRQAIEPIIGHMKSDGKLGRNFLKGKTGDFINALLCAIGQNIRFILRALSPKPA